jgi:V/A-type H+-transporting ATPase subunit A
MATLQEEAELDEIVKMVGKDSLGKDDQLTLEIAKMIREDFLQQNSFNEVDWYSSFDRQFRLLDMILKYDTLCRDAITKGASLADLTSIDAREKIGRAKSVPDDEYVEAYAAIEANMAAQIEKIIAKAGADDYD